MSSASEEWAARLNKVELPGLSQVITKLLSLTDSDESAASELAAIALNDAAVTSKILKTANSAAFNPSGAKLNTISRAIVYLGFDQVRSIAISVMMLEHLKNDAARPYLDVVIGDSLCAASFAKHLNADENDQVKESVFIAALLARVGELAFWGAKASKEQRILMSSLEGSMKSIQRISAVKNVLGCSFDELSYDLSKGWNLSDEILDTMQAKPTTRLGGIAKLSTQIIQQPEGAVRDKLMATIGRLCAKGAAEVASALEYARADQPEVLKALGIENDDEQIEEQVLEGDSVKLMAVLKDLSDPSNQASLDVIFRLVTEGIFQGVGLRRVALMINVKGVFETRYTLGSATGHWKEFLRINSELLDSSELRNISYASPSLVVLGSELDARIQQQIGHNEILFGGLVKADRVVALVIGDVGTEKLQIDEKAQGEFAHVLMQANQRLALI